MKKFMLVVLMLFCVFGFTVCAKTEITDEQFEELCIILIDNLDPDEYSIIDSDLLSNIYIKHNEVVLIGPNCKKIKQWSINEAYSSKSKKYIENIIFCSNYSVVDSEGEKSDNGIFNNTNIGSTITFPSFNILKAKLNKIVEQYKNKKQSKEIIQNE